MMAREPPAAPTATSSNIYHHPYTTLHHQHQRQLLNQLQHLTSTHTPANLHQPTNSGASSQATSSIANHNQNSSSSSSTTSGSNHVNNNNTSQHQQLLHHFTLNPHHHNQHHLHQMQHQQQQQAHQQLLHHFPTLNPHLQQQQQGGASQAPQLFHHLTLNSSSSPQIHHHQHHSNQSNSTSSHNSQQAYNVNSSDYSSSTYHVYDQILGDQIIDDLIVIKQERMKKKLEEEHRRKVILFSVAVSLLVCLLMFLIVQLFKVSSSSSSSSAVVSTSSPVAREIIGSATPPPPMQSINSNELAPAPTFGVGRPFWAPPVGVQSKPPAWQFDPSYYPASSYQQQTSTLTIQQTPRQQQQQPVIPPVILPVPFSPPTIQQQFGQLPALAQPPPPPVQQMPPTTSSATTDLSSVQSEQRQSDAIGGTTTQQPNLETATPSVSSSSVDLEVREELREQLAQNKLMTKCLESNCNNNGQCTPTGRCLCFDGFVGTQCEFQLERQCDDGLDNDKDGLVDCADSECCSNVACQNSTLCMKSPDPVDILMRKPPPPPTSSFFQRMQFLIEKFSSQIYSHPNNFNDSRASVIRGRVTYQKQGVIGVRVLVAGQKDLGITLSRDNGYFDLMVNGGGAIVVEFSREPFATAHQTIRVPWNEIVVMDSIELQLDVGGPMATQTLNAEPASTSQVATPVCSAHDYQLLKPHVTSAIATAAAATSQQDQASAMPKQQRLFATPSTSRMSSGSSRSAVMSKLFGGAQRSAQNNAPTTTHQSFVVPNSAQTRATNQQQQQLANDSANAVAIVCATSRASEFVSTISVQLTPTSGATTKLSEDLKLIHLKIVIEGNAYEETFEPRDNLSYTQVWNRRNVYRQKSYGLSTAAVSVGYEYFDCAHIIWTTRHVQVPGHDLSISDIGSECNLNIHHRFNYRDSIVQRGDGHNFNLKSERAHVVAPLMGDGYQRQPICAFCDGATTPLEQRLLKPQALVSAPDGALYVGDFNLIRRIEPPPPSAGGSFAPTASVAVPAAFTRANRDSERVVRTVLELPTSRVPNKYGLALNLAHSSGPRLYMNDIERHQVFWIRERNADSTSSSSSLGSLANESAPTDEVLVPVVGVGVKCQLDDRTSCGDGQPAKLARLNEPRALAFDLSGRMYIADGPNVRLVDTNQKIYTLLGDYGMSRHTKFPCTGEAIPMHKFVPSKPLDLAFNPLDDTLHVLDDNVVYKVTPDKRVQVVAGRPAHCNLVDARQTNRAATLKATDVTLQWAQSIAFDQHGRLFISEDDQRQHISRVLVVSPDDDSISLYAGQLVEPSAARTTQPTNQLTIDALQHTSEQQASRPQHSATTTTLLGQTDKQRSSNALPAHQATRALDYKFNSIAALALDQQGNLLVADKVQLRIVAIEPDVPQMSASGEYEIQSPYNPDELLVFNRYGHQVATRELLANHQQQRATNKYTFSYTVNTPFGQLTSVQYSGGNKISIHRDGPHHSVKLIETAFGGQCKFDWTRSAGNTVHPPVHCARSD